MPTLLSLLPPLSPPKSANSCPSSSTISPSSSITAVSRSPSPPSSRRSSKMFSFRTLHLPIEDDEKGLPGPGPSSSRHMRLRKRRMLSQGVATVAVLGIVGLWMGGIMSSYEMPGLGDWRKPSGTGAAIPGIVIGEGGVYLGAKNAPTNPLDSLIHTWGVDLKTNHFLDGLTSWHANTPIDESVPPLSVLGQSADDIYKLGPLDITDYTAQLSELATVAFPKHVTERLQEGLKRYLGGEAERGESWDVKKKVWQTDRNTRHSESDEVASWKGGKTRDEGWEWELLTDPQADEWISENFGGSRVEMIWKTLPSGILRSDTLRYLLLLVEGGIYSDTDTNLLKAPHSFGQGARLWRNGEGWLDDASRQRIISGEGIDAVLGKPSVIVGIEADVGNRDDWYDWWPRPMQIVQWTMAMAPNHPIAISAILRVLHSTADAVEWSHTHATQVRQLKELGRYEDSRNLLATTVLAEPKQGGPVGVMAWTGPGVWTDAVLSYVRVRYGMVWTDLKDIREPLRVGDVVILPVTGFSPGVGNFGSQNVWHKEAMVEHLFEGSWKDEPKT